MPVCPSCHEEYEEGVRLCADCEVELVGSLDEIPPPPPEEEEREFEGEVRFLVLGGSLAGEIHEILLGRGIPCYLYRKAVAFEGREVARLAVPGEFEEAALAALRMLPYDEVEGPRGETRLFVPPGLEEGEAVLARTDEEILASGETGREALVSAILGGGPAAAARAVRLLHRSGASGHGLLSTILLEAAAAGKGGFVSSFLFLLKPYTLHPPEEGLAALLADGDSEVRRLGVRILAGLRGREGLPGLVSMLEDGAAEVRDEAIEGLFRITGDDLGYEPEGPEEERAQALERWRKRVAGG